MSETIINCPAGFFQDDPGNPTTLGDLVSAVATADNLVAEATAAQAAAAASAVGVAEYASSAFTSSLAAASSATAAGTSETNAASSATSAATSATSAASSATSAATSATSAATSATSAGISATSATTSASGASTSATAASNSASAASASATSAAASATTVGQPINAKNPTYGAVGNGTTNDTAAIQAAMNAAGTAGCACYIPAGVYRITQLTWPSGMTGLIGAGRYATTLKRLDSDSTTHYQITATSRTGIQLYGMTLDGNKANNATTVSAGLILTSCGQVDVRDTRIINQQPNSGANFGWGILVTTSVDGANGTYTTIENCEFTNNRFGVLGQMQSKNIVVRGCVFYGPSIAASGTTAGMSCIAVGLNDSNPGDTTGCTIVGNTINGCSGGIGIGTIATGFVRTLSQSCSVVGNTVTGTYSYGCTMDGTDLTFSGNTIVNCGQGGPNAGLLANSNQCNIHGNTFDLNASFDIDLGGSTNCIVSGNYFGNCGVSTGTGTNINCGGGFNNLITGNNFTPGANNSACIAPHAYDAGSHEFPYAGPNVTVINNTFNMGTFTSTWGVLVGGAPTGIVIKNNVFSGGGEGFLIWVVSQKALVTGNVWTGAIGGTSQAAASGVNFPDYADTILLTGSGTTINKINTSSQNSASGKIIGVQITNEGSSYTSAPTLSVSGDGAGATLTAALNDQQNVSGVNITNSGTSTYTTATIGASGGGGSGFAATALIGTGAATQGRDITIINTSGNSQTITNGSTMKLAGGSNLTFTNGSILRLRGTGASGSSPIFTEISRAIQ